jgi:anaerobic magnesium-protoporphyrin IX monomethyl ester cyclase
MGYVAAYLKSRHITEVRIIDTTFENLDERLTQMTHSHDTGKNTSPLIVGIYIMTPYMKKAGDTIVHVKKRFPGSVIVTGGPHPTIAPEEVLQRFPVDVCVRGEGEKTFSRLVASLIKQEDFTHIPGISLKDPGTGKIRHNPGAEPVEDINTLPFPARELLPMEYYLKGGTQKTFSYKKIKATTMITSRGCPHNCSYCQPTLRTIFGKRVRFRSVENVMEEIEVLISTYGIQGLFILDDTFTCNKKFVAGFCNEILKRNIHLSIAINSRVDTINEGMLDLLKEAGIETIMFGIESGSRKVLDNLQKGTTLEQINNAVLWTKKRGIRVYGYFIIGSPMESRETLEQTFSLVKRLPFDEVQFSMAAPYKGTHLYEQAHTMDLCTGAELLEEKGYFSAATMKSLFLTPEEIQKYHRRFTRYARFKSVRNLLKHPGAIPSLFMNRILGTLVHRAQR